MLLKLTAEETKMIKVPKNKKTESRASKATAFLRELLRQVRPVYYFYVLRDMGLGDGKYLWMQLSDGNDDEWPKFDEHYTCS